MNQHESNPQVSYDQPPVRRKRRKKTPWQTFKEAYHSLCFWSWPDWRQ